MHRASVKAGLSDCTEIIVQLPNKSMIHMCRAANKMKGGNEGWQTAANSCHTKLMIPIPNRLKFQNFKFILWQYISQSYTGLVRVYYVVKLKTVFSLI